MRVLLATRNPGKIAELRRILTGFDIVGLDEFPDIGDVVETGVTFEDNALLKAREVARQAGLPSVADDSGLCVDVLNGMPGVFSARWSGRHGDDQANLDLVLAQLSDVADEHRGAAFVCAAALVLPNGREHLVEGRQLGRIIRTRRGTGGFGYDPVFLGDGQDRTNAELTAEEKDAISHRGKAFRSLAKVIAKELAPERR